jgi:predicted transcriptional regulator
MSAWTRGGPLDAIRIEDAMAKQVFSVKPDQDVGTAETLMAQKQVRRLPVVDANDKPIGILSMNDLAREAAKHGSKLRDGLSRAIRTFASICQPRKREQKAA